MLQTLTARLSIAAAMLALTATAASGATRNFTINTADIVDLYSATFDPALTPCAAPVTQECTFFTGTTPATRAIVIAPTGTGSGTMNVTYNDATGEITQVNSLIINLPTIKLTITPSTGGLTVVDIIPGNGFPVSANGDAAFAEAGTGTAGRDLNGPLVALVSVGQGTADADQAPAIGQFPVFHHSDSPNLDNTDFAVFSEVVDTCVDTAPAGNCSLITLDLLTLDAIRYRLEGRVSCGGPGFNSLVLKSQTANNSIYKVNFTVTANDADCDGDTLLNGADNCPDVSNLANQADNDSDGRGNVCDNCIAKSNNAGAGAQADSDSDGFGNRCDGDLNNNGATNAQDTSIFRKQLGLPSVGPVYHQADLITNGAINAQDTSVFRTLLGLPAGPGAGP
ncbi:MAG: hypothetical protein E4H19_13545 [Chromatiales bacterium]|nr:MAG: hypothetical protein E4H19_13545 [Chromatiales bacterium]